MLVHPTTRNREADAAGAFVVKTLPGKRGAELRLNRSALCVEGVEQGFVVRRNWSVDV